MNWRKEIWRLRNNCQAIAEDEADNDKDLNLGGRDGRERKRVMKHH